VHSSINKINLLKCLNSKKNSAFFLGS